MREHYIIEHIESKSGEIKEVHKEILGRECWPMKIEVGRRGWLLVDVGDDEFGPHRIVLSIIQELEDNEDRLRIYTENTIYHLRGICNERNIIVGEEYLFYNRVLDGTENDDDKRILSDCNGLNCKVISFCEDVEDKGYGKLVIVSCCNGETLNVYECELEELKENDVRYYFEDEE